MSEDRQSSAVSSLRVVRAPNPCHRLDGLAVMEEALSRFCSRSFDQTTGRPRLREESLRRCHPRGLVVVPEKTVEKVDARKAEAEERERRKRSAERKVRHLAVERAKRERHEPPIMAFGRFLRRTGEARRHPSLLFRFDQSGVV